MGLLSTSARLLITVSHQIESVYPYVFQFCGLSELWAFHRRPNYILLWSQGTRGGYRTRGRHWKHSEEEWKTKNYYEQTRHTRDTMNKSHLK